MQDFDCFRLMQKKNHRRSGTAILIFPGFVPMYSNLSDEVKLLSEFGDVLAFHYPERELKLEQFYDHVTNSIQQLGYKKLILFGISFGGTLAYLLMRKWRHQKKNMGVKGFVALSTPFEPDNLTPISQFQLDIGLSLDRYARKIFIVLVKALRWLWSWTLYAKDNSFKQNLTALWMAGYTLNREWFIKKKFYTLPALLLNVRREVRDYYVRRTNALDFEDIFQNSQVLEVLNRHADFEGVSQSTKRQVRGWLREVCEAR